MSKMPAWADMVLIPLISLILAGLLSALVILAIGESPIEAVNLMITGALGSSYGWGYTLYYATNFMFTGLAVSVAFHARLFNIGGEGQAMLGGLGVALACLYIPWPHWSLALLGAIICGAAFGGLWALLPAYLQAKRGSHIVITTIMFNFLAASIMVSLLAGMLKSGGQMSPETRAFTDAASLPMIHEILQGLGFDVARSPLNLSFVIALLACVGVWGLVWRSRLGYAIRAVGQSPQAAQYAGISIERIIIITMAISGGLAGLMAINEILGVQHRVILNFTSGYGFTGIAVALMGRNHPFGIILASLLFGALYQGGAELDFEFSTITREMVLMIQGLIILFSGALSFMFQKPLQRLFSRLTAGSETETAHG